jgi:hypothetical protein
MRDRHRNIFYIYVENVPVTIYGFRISKPGAGA